MKKKVYTRKQFTEKVHAEVGKSMGIDFQTRILHGVHKATKGDYTVEEGYVLLKEMVDEGTIPPTDPAALPEFKRLVEEARKR